MSRKIQMLLLGGVLVVSPLGKIGNALAASFGMRLWKGVFDLQVRRKTQALAAGAVMLIGIMGIEWHLVFGRVILGAAFSRLRMADSDQMMGRCVMEGFGNTVERGDEAVGHRGRTLPGRRARSKPATRVGDGGHEESKPAK